MGYVFQSNTSAQSKLLIPFCDTYSLAHYTGKFQNINIFIEQAKSVKNKVLYFVR